MQNANNCNKTSGDVSYSAMFVQITSIFKSGLWGMSESLGKLHNTFQTGCHEALVWCIQHCSTFFHMPRTGSFPGKVDSIPTRTLSVLLKILLFRISRDTQWWHRVVDESTDLYEPAAVCSHMQNLLQPALSFRKTFFLVVQQQRAIFMHLHRCLP